MSERGRAKMTAEAAATAPAIILPPEDIADGVIELIRDYTLAGRIMLAYEGEPRRLLPVGSAE